MPRGVLETLDLVLGQADILVIMLALTPLTRGLLDRDALALLPHGAAVINVARGSLVDQTALTELLQSGHIGAATLDAFEKEPLPEDDPLWQLPNVLITPHLASVAIPASAAEQIARNLVSVANGRPLANLIDIALGDRVNCLPLLHESLVSINQVFVVQISATTLFNVE